MAEPAIHWPQKTRELHNHHFDSTIDDLKRDLPSEIRRMAAFLDLPLDEARYPAIIEHCSFDYMKSHATKSVPLGGAFWEGGAETFIHRGTNGCWRDVLAPEDCAAYEAKARAELGENCARWLAGGPGVA